jgi:hypothetical protein
MDWFSDTEKVRAVLKITFTLQRSLFALTFVQLTEIAYLSHFSWPHQTNLSHCFHFTIGAPTFWSGGSNATDPLSVCADQCPLWSVSGQTRAWLDCPLCATSGLMHRNKQHSLPVIRQPPPCWPSVLFCAIRAGDNYPSSRRDEKYPRI